MFAKLHRLKLLFAFDNRAQLLFNRICCPSRPSMTYQLDGLEVFIDHSAGDQDGTRSCLVPGLYLPVFEEFSSLPRKLTVMDLGANGGGFLLALRHAGYEIGQALAVELNPHTWSRLTLNVYRNLPQAPSRTILLNGAAGGNEGEISIRLGRGSVSDSMELQRDEEGGETYLLPVYSWRNLIDRIEGDVDLCKIDIEGAEYDLFRDATEDDLLRVKRLLIELHEVPGETMRDLREKIAGLGFVERIPQRPFPEPHVHLYIRGGNTAQADTILPNE